MATVPATRGAFPASADAAADATRALYERFSCQIFAYCLVQLRNREEAEDATQTTFLNAFRGLERGVVPELESAWLYKIAQHVCLTQQRSWSRRRLVESPQDLEQVRELAESPASSSATRSASPARTACSSRSACRRWTTTASGSPSSSGGSRR